MRAGEILGEKRTEILRIAAMHGARNVRVFGSVARGEEGEGSDVDLLVEIEKGRSILDLGSLQMDLQEMLGVPVDVVEEGGLRPSLRERILSEAVSL